MTTETSERQTMTATTIRTVGFIGLGDQGAPMARAVADSAFELHVWARRAASLGAVEGLPTGHDPGEPRNR
jgi:3-hydroxyisobutyrate dehydrogenase-like beta-hydroxyacid dehydrogenase